MCYVHAAALVAEYLKRKGMYFIVICSTGYPNMWILKSVNFFFVKVGSLDAVIVFFLT